jgi:archaeosine synthase alpha-subunit
MRSFDRWEGLATAGRASFGPLGFDLPAVLAARPAGDDGPGPFVSAEPSPSGTRRLVLGDGRARRTIELPVLAPEIAPPGTGVVPLADGVALLHAPLDRAALRELRANRPELLVLGNARALWNEGEPLVAAVRAIRTEVGADPILWAPRLALPHRLPLLAYLGFDLTDTTEGELRASRGEFLDPALGSRPGDDAADRGCDCAACASEPVGPLVDHARLAYRRAEREVAAAVRQERLRELVEARLAAEPTSAEILRYADRDLAELLESRAPVTGGRSRTYVLAESLRRPEMRRFRDRLIERYRPPTLKSVLLLVPCSRTKPYRRSPSHRRFASAFEELRAAERVHLVSVSSPIGIVPRELEDVPPARQYDIPVTGDWSAEERELVARGVRHLLQHGRYRRVVLHLDPAEYGFLDAPVAESGLPVARSCEDARTTAPAAIERLRAELRVALAEEAGVPGGPLAVVTEELRELASVQFGREAAERLFRPPLRLMGRPWFQRLTDGHHDLASVREERGLFHLTVAGALRLGEALPAVDADPALSLEGDLFAPGVVRADPRIRAGDSVGLRQDGRLAAVGEAVVPGPVMGDVRRGVAVKVRHRHHASADTAKTSEPPPDVGR